jgi:hypothetical protein
MSIKAILVLFGWTAFLLTCVLYGVHVATTHRPKARKTIFVGLAIAAVVATGASIWIATVLKRIYG